MKQLTLLSRSYCSLCSNMLNTLRTLQTQYDFRVTLVDIDDAPEWLAQYDEMVPVLLDEQKKEICHWYLDEKALAKHCKI